MNVLFVCSRNQWRSRTAETIFRNHSKCVVKSAGTEKSARIKVTARLIIWADIIFVMEKRHRQRLSENFPTEIATKKIVVLDIADEYHYMDDELVELLKTAVAPYFEP